ncbi:hypothetical protein SAMD00019534_124230 [Acytostelium subglobosum LB1]|uniref:hypothetical protein n=1 Tax=Acytostelium subglobosum LB1 TaxID=1410327 RepID=UPI0006451298|nr:hypothetical protein SAMD00019534_124230 [Acytostelium subglobosum LB1]GAM29247.1 hypothetical protein SAMD00019534_124230 [Acytostelium subglobosum LB1]|eukprot:XP_012747821.1 hypothetical protein SAMD00019534_124230 [Acytostelium subglobosum LB1]
MNDRTILELKGDKPLPATLPNSNMFELTILDVKLPLSSLSFPSTLKILSLGRVYRALSVGSLPSSLTELNIDRQGGTRSTCPIVPGVIPSSVTSLYLTSYNLPLATGVIPPSVIKCRLNLEKQDIEPGLIPYSVTELTVEVEYGKIMLGSIPSSVTQLTIMNHYEPLEPGTIPSSVKRLAIMHYRDKSSLMSGLGNFPTDPISEFRRGLLSTAYLITILPTSNLTDLSFASRYDQPIVEGMLPRSLTRLSLRMYNQPLTPTSLPRGLLHLDMFSYDQPLLANVLPSGMTSLSLYSYRSPFDWHTIPLTSLSIDRYQGLIEPGSLPTTLRSLFLSTVELQQGSLPNGLQHLKFNHTDNMQVIPASVTKLDIFGGDKIPDGIIPPSVIDLELYTSVRPAAGSLPPSLTNLYHCSSNMDYQYECLTSLKSMRINFSSLRHDVEPFQDNVRSVKIFTSTGVEEYKWPELKEKWWRAFTMFQPGTTITLNSPMFVCRILDHSTALILSPKHIGGLFNFRQ